MTAMSIDVCPTDNLVDDLRREIKLAERKNKKLSVLVDSRLSEIRVLKRKLRRAENDIVKLINANND